MKIDTMTTVVVTGPAPESGGQRPGCSVKETPAAEFRRVTEVTYLGCVHGTMSALARMLDSGVIVQVGSALAYRSMPLQASYCGAKHAIAPRLAGLLLGPSTLALSAYGSARLAGGDARRGARPAGGR